MQPPATPEARPRPRNTKSSAPAKPDTPSPYRSFTIPSQITYGELLRVFFSVAHDPTQLNRQGPDEGTQYRSSIFYSNDEQKRIAEAYIAQLDNAKVFPRPIVTKVVPLQAFYPAEAYHQNYAALHPNQPYIMFNDAPKVEHLRQEFPELYTGK